MSFWEHLGALVACLFVSCLCVCLFLVCFWLFVWEECEERARRTRKAGKGRRTRKVGEGSFGCLFGKRKARRNK